MKKIQVNNIELAYNRRGTGNPLVLLHGYPLDHYIWDEVVQLLDDKFDLIVPDLRGFGSSSTVDTPYTLNDFASDLAGLLDQLGIQKTALAGHSMGGYTALAFANLYPDRVNGLGMVSSQALADAPEHKEGRYKTASEIAEHGIQSVVNSMPPKLTPNKNVQLFVQEMIARQQAAALIGALKAIAQRNDTLALISKINCPVAIIHGDTDDLIPIDRARELKNLIPHAHFVELMGVGHMPMLEAPQETASALLKLG